MKEEIRIGAKYVLALSIKDLAKNKSLDKITVREIVDNCEATRQTFYYHFKDKYDLINWIYESGTYKIRRTFSIETWDSNLNMLFSNIKENQRFYENLFTSNQRELFINFLYKNTYDFYTNYIKRHFGKNLFSDKLAFAVEFYSYGAVNITKRWSEKGFIEYPELIAERVFLNIPPELKNLRRQL